MIIKAAVKLIKKQFKLDKILSYVEEPNELDEEVERLRGSIKIEYSMCKHQSEKLWKLLNTEPYINTLGSLSGNHAVQHAKAGLKAIYLSGWQVAADANSAGEMYPDQSLYPYDSAPKLVESMLSLIHI